jgi:translocation and assembly module TamB
MSKVLLRWGKRLCIGLVSFALVVVLLIGTLLYTTAGLQLMIWAGEKTLPQLQINNSEGAILSGFTLFELSFKDDELNIDLKSRELALVIDANCLLTPSVCIDDLRVVGLRVSLPELPLSSSEPSEQSAPTAEINLPFAIHINNLELNDIGLDILGNTIDWQRFATRLEMHESYLNIYPTEFDEVNVRLANAEVEADEQAKQNGEVVKKDNTANSAELNESIQLPDVLIPLAIDLKQFDMRQFTLHGERPIKINHLGISASAHKHQVTVRELILDLPEANLGLMFEVELKGEYPLSLDAKAQIKETELKGQSIALKATGSLENLELDMILTELIESSLVGQIAPLKPELPFDFLLTKGKAQWPLTGEADYTVELAKLKAKGSLDGYQLDLATVIDGKQVPNLDIELLGEGDLGQIELESIVIKALGGEVDGSVMANWQSPINWQADLSLDNIQPGLEWKEAEGVINGVLSTSGELTSTGGWQIELPILDINGVVREYPLDIEGSVSASDKDGKGDLHLTTTGLSLKHGPNGVDISGELGTTWNIDTIINLPEVNKSIPDLTGQVNGQVNLRGPLKTPQVQTQLVAQNLTYLDTATVAKINVSGDITPLPAPSGDIRLDVNGITYQTQKIDSVGVAFSGSKEKHQASFSMLSEMVSTKLQVNGGIKEQDNLSWEGVLNKAEIATEQGPWRLKKQVSLSYDAKKQQAYVQAHCWTQASSQLCLIKDLFAGESGEAHLEVDRFDFKQIEKYIPQELVVAGELNAVTKARWSPDSSPDVEVSIELPKGSVAQNTEQPVTLGWQSISLNAQLQNNTLAANWLLDLKDNGDIKGGLNIDDVQSDHRELDAQLALNQLNLDMIQPLLGEYSQFNAAINSELTLSGPVIHPRVNGKFVVDDLVASGEVTPIEVTSGKLEVDFSGYDAILNADIDTPDGVLQIDGDANWKNLKDWATNIKVYAQELDVNVPPMVKAKIKPDLKIAASPKFAKIEGDIYLPWGRVTVEELPASAIEPSSDEVILDSQLQPVETNTELPMAVETNVNIHIGDDFTLAAFGLKGNLQGKLNVSQKDKGPFIIGEIEILNGSYRSFGQDLIIDEGKVLMNGPADQPYLAIEAIRNPDNTQDDVVAGIRVTGPANEPIIDVFSEPAMPQQNALSYLLSGQDIDGKSGGNSMTTALIGLSLAKSGRVVGQIGETFGVSDLQLDTEGAGDDSQVTVSGYLTPELQIKYGVGIFDSFGEFTVRYKLVTDLYLEAVSGMDSAVDLLYQFEFD